MYFTYKESIFPENLEVKSNSGTDIHFTNGDKAVTWKDTTSYHTRLNIEYRSKDFTIEGYVSGEESCCDSTHYMNLIMYNKKRSIKKILVNCNYDELLYEFYDGKADKVKSLKWNTYSYEIPSYYEFYKSGMVKLIRYFKNRRELIKEITFEDKKLEEPTYIHTGFFQLDFEHIDHFPMYNNLSKRFGPISSTTIFNQEEIDELKIKLKEKIDALDYDMLKKIESLIK